MHYVILEFARTLLIILSLYLFYMTADCHIILSIFNLYLDHVEQFVPSYQLH